MRILIIEQDPRLRAELEQALRLDGHDVLGVATGDAGCRALGQHRSELVLCDAGAPDFDAMEFLASCSDPAMRTTVIMTGPCGDDGVALGSIRGGAFDYIPRPFRADHAVLIVRKAIEQQRLRSEVQRLRDALHWARADDAAATDGPSGHRLVTTPRGTQAMMPGEEDLSVKRRTATLERTLIRRALERTGGNRTRAARLLELSHRALLYKIREYGLQS